MANSLEELLQQGKVDEYAYNPIPTAEEEAVESPMFLLDPDTYITGGIAGAKVAKALGKAILPEMARWTNPIPFLDDAVLWAAKRVGAKLTPRVAQEPLRQMSSIYWTGRGAGGHLANEALVKLEDEATRFARMPSGMSPEITPAVAAGQKIYRSAQKPWSTPITGKTAERFRTAKTTAKEAGTRKAVVSEAQLEKSGWKLPIKESQTAEAIRSKQDILNALKQTSEEAVPVTGTKPTTKKSLPIKRKKKEPPKGNEKSKAILDLITKSEE